MPEPQKFLCRYCGTPLLPGQRFCSNCGQTAEGNINQATERSVDAEDTVLPGSMANDRQQTPPPPPPGTFESGPRPGSYPDIPIYQPQQGYRPDVPPMAQVPVPAYATPTKDSSRGVLRQVGCGFLVVILLVLALCGGVGYFVYHQVASSVNQATTQASTTTQSSNNNNSNNNTPNAPKPVVTTLNIQPVTYSSVKMTIQNVQQAASFADDDTNTSGVLRIALSEENTSANGTYYNYSEAMLLLLPDNTSIHPN
ncbi:zinc ribbon domain-containing protein [Dictyobacter kobayashii]|uniref:Zinc-ribbon domain-containing protein n=1 Tax=Dictyobacter kobayashii TaxID=2014872 RepID=A0A402AU39_9CHLR|nr:zinc ribbon domain-containing protein [Dictyobacter kobayashii]GCE22604.1 hypothetical protein KDK_64040 [Dictyobacter kobayashii]